MFTTKFYDIFSGKMVEFKTKPKVRAPEPSLHRPGITVLADGKLMYQQIGHYLVPDDKPKTAAAPASAPAIEEPPYTCWNSSMDGPVPCGWYWAWIQLEEDCILRWSDGKGGWSESVSWKEYARVRAEGIRGLTVKQRRTMYWAPIELNINSDSIRPRKVTPKGV